MIPPEEPMDSAKRHQRNRARSASKGRDCRDATDERAAAILCGGESRRMGQDKATLPWNGATLLEHMVGVVRAAVSPVTVVAAPGQSLPSLPQEVSILRDENSGLGPLEGLRVALRHFSTAGGVAVVGCDAPGLLPVVVDLLLTRLAANPEVDAVAVRRDGQWQPLLAAYRPRVAAVCQQLLQSGRRSLWRLLEAIEAQPIEAGMLREFDPQLACLINANDPATYASARRIDLGRQGRGSQDR